MSNYTVSTLIEKLQAVKEEHGDLPIVDDEFLMLFLCKL